ncbi:uncharacterized protein AB675_9030 [Cyphellophora attinorum]|uniref:Uncharacterized protein n=1 Tax=Cyphellophora attinorum TaxID=1664694 RepID=A0A0N1H6H1_9EURO|nr:uncharacterized protein AB675_9030 [Phialophora attinorum]KPI41635.1 hypothetical protein AB675_9030 [Phialophora attinorum]
MSLNYGEGFASAWSRLSSEIAKAEDIPEPRNIVAKRFGLDPVNGQSFHSWCEKQFELGNDYDYFKLASVHTRRSYLRRIGASSDACDSDDPAYTTEIEEKDEELDDPPGGVISELVRDFDKTDFFGEDKGNDDESEEFPDGFTAVFELLRGHVVEDFDELDFF